MTVTTYDHLAEVWGQTLRAHEQDTNPHPNGGSHPDYLIYPSGGQTVAQAFDAGLSNYSGSDPVTVFQSAINALRGVGGRVEFKGNHTFTSGGITVYPSIALVGQGPLEAIGHGTSSITATAAVTGPIITALVDPGNPLWQVFPYLANFSIDGAAGSGATTQDGVYFSDVNGAMLDAYMDEVLIFNAGGNGINHASTCKLWIDKCYLELCKQNGLRSSLGTVRITDSYIFQNALYGLDPTSSSQLWATGNEVWNNGQSAAAGLGGAIMVWSLSSGCLIAHNSFRDNGSVNSPSLTCKDFSGSSKRLTINNNQFQDTRGGTAVNYHLKFAINSGVQASVVGNTFQGAITQPIFVTPQAANQLLVKDNLGFNDTVGKLATPFSTTALKVGIEGTLAAPVASTAYKVDGSDLYIASTGGTGVSITLTDAGGNTLQSGLATFAGIVPVGCSINFGAFSVAPTVVAAVA